MRILEAIRPPKLPREHGGWAMLALPIVLGFALTGFRPSSGWWIGPAAVLAYLAHETLTGVADAIRRGRPIPPARRRARLAWGAAELGCGLWAFGQAFWGAPPACRQPLVALATAATACAIAHAVGSFAGNRRSTAVEVAGMAAMALSAPMIAAASDAWDGARSIAAVALAGAYFASSLVYVRAYDRGTRSFGDRAATCVVVHGILVLGLAGLWFTGLVPPLGVAAFVPVFGRTLWSVARPPSDLRKLGMREVWVVGGYAVLASAALAI